MANNIPVTPGSGVVVKTDEVAGEHVQLVKLMDGTEDSAERIPGDATKGLKVQVTDIAGGVPSGDPDTANPVKVGGVHKTVLPTVPDGRVVDFQMDDRGRLIVTISPVADKSAFAIGTDPVTPTGGIYQVSVDTLSDGKVAAMAIDSHRNLMMTLATILAFEDQTNLLAAVLPKPVVGSTYSPNFYAPMTLSLRRISKLYLATS